MRPSLSGMRGRLLALAALNAAALILVGGMVFVSFERIEGLTRRMARDELARVVANAGLERGLAAINARIALLARSCRDATIDADWPEFIDAFAEVGRRDIDLAVASEITQLVPVANALVESCQRIRSASLRLRALDSQLFAEIGSLDAITARAIIDYTLARRDLSHLDQIMLLISGFRETALLAGKRIADHASGGADTDRLGALELLGELEIRVQSFVAASPEMSNSRTRIVVVTRLLRLQAEEIFAAIARFEGSVARAMQAKERITTLTTGLDEMSASRARALDRDLQMAIDQAIERVAFAAAAVVLLSLLLTIWIIRTGIQQPLAHVLRQVDAIRRGDLTAAKPPDRADEWGQIQSALSQMMAELSQALNTAQNASAAKSQFLAVMSHELRTPMNGIMGLAEVIATEDMDASRRRDYARTIAQSGEALLKILNDILDLSKVEAGRFTLEPVRFLPPTLLGEIRALYADIARERNLTLEIAWLGPQTIYCADSGRIRQMLSNLVNNALKFTVTGAIRIEGRERTSPAGAGEAEIEFSVADTGPGMTPDEAAQLFQPFSRLDNAVTRKAGGTGLGLSIVRMLAHQMSGTAGVESAPGSGARFWFTLRAGKPPADLGAAPEDATRRDATSAQRRLAGRILVAEDVAANRMVIEAFLRRLGLECHSVEDGDEAVVHATAAERPTLVLMDCNMPRLDGFDATRAIRRHERAQGRAPVPIVAMTARAFEEDRERCAAVGMDAFLAKPLKFAQVAEMLALYCPPADPAPRATARS